MTTKEKMAIKAYQELSAAGIPLSLYHTKSLPDELEKISDFVKDVKNEATGKASGDEISKVLDHIM